jgi:hypothetical protein
MSIIIYSIDNFIQFKSTSSNKEEVVKYRIMIGLNLIKEFGQDLFSISHIDYFNP